MWTQIRLLLRSSLIWVHTVCLYAKTSLKSLQEYSADDINRRHFQMQFFLVLLGLTLTMLITTATDDIYKKIRLVYVNLHEVLALFSLINTLRIDTCEQRQTPIGQLIRMQRMLTEPLHRPKWVRQSKANTSELVRHLIGTFTIRLHKKTFNLYHCLGKSRRRQTYIENSL